MVAPYDIGDPARSFIRIPGTGSDPSLRGVCLDLSQGSEAAAASPIPQNIPRLSLTSGYASKLNQRSVTSEKSKETSRIQTTSSQSMSVERQHHAQTTTTESRTTLSNNLQGVQSDQHSAQKLPPKNEKKDCNNNVLKRKMTEPQIMMPCKVIKVNTGKIVAQSIQQQRINSDIKTIKFRTVSHPTINSIKKSVKRMSSPKSFNTNGAASNSRHPRGNPGYEKKGRLHNYPNQIKDQLFQEIFKDKRRLAALLKRLNVIRKS